MVLAGLGGTISDQTFSIPPKKGRQVTVSEGHPWSSHKKGKFTGDIGGDFTTTKQYVISNANRFSLHTYRVLVPGFPSFYDATYNGWVLPVNPHDPTISFPNSGQSTEGELSQLGATAVARCKPTNSIADAATFMGELLKDGLPSLLGAPFWQNKTHVARGAGSEYLNWQFGWAPLLNDIRGFAEAVRKAHKVLDQYERDAGKLVRRRYEFPLSTTVSEETFKVNQLAYIEPGNSELSRDQLKGTVIRQRSVVKRQWFSGAFTYHLPTANDWRSELVRKYLLADQLLGTALTPDTLWNLAPWSWAVDWFSNAGDVISNLTDWATDGLVMPYGYIMEHTRVSDTYTMDRTGLIGVPGIAPISFVTETKLRRKANPFGFGVSWDGLSPRQLLIAAALGLTRG
jgi:hypothetical protein